MRRVYVINQMTTDSIEWARMEFSGRFLALDTETTGTNRSKDRIVELFVVEVDSNLNVGPSFLQRFNPEMPIPPAATAVHGIRDEDVCQSPPFHSLAARIQTMLTDAVLIAFNGLTFDLPLLHEELVRAGQRGLDPNPTVIDPYRLFVEDAPRTLSGAVRHYLGRDHDSAHSAESDVRAMLAVLRVQWARRHAKAPRLEDLRFDDGREWLDASRCFYREDGVVRFGFGKHRGEPATHFPGYLKWMSTGDFSGQTKEVARTLLVACSG